MLGGKMLGLRRMTRRAGPRFHPGLARRWEKGWSGWMESRRSTAARFLARMRLRLAHWQYGRFAVLTIGRDFTSAIWRRLFEIIRGLKPSSLRRMCRERIATE